MCRRVVKRSCINLSKSCVNKHNIVGSKCSQHFLCYVNLKTHTRRDSYDQSLADIQVQNSKDDYWKR